MEPPCFVAESDLKSRFSAQRWLELFDDDNDGVADAIAVREVLDDANAEVMARLLGKGFTAERLELMTEDRFLRRQAASIAMGFAGERRPAFLNGEGRGPYDKQRDTARELLDKTAKGLLRAPGETDAGGNTAIVGRLSKNQHPHGHLVFAPTAEDRARGSRGKGGF